MGNSSSDLASDEAVTRATASIVELGQGHLIQGWTEQTLQSDKVRFLQQLQQVDSSYPGGVKSYVKNAKVLLAESKAGLNPLEGWAPAVPSGATMEFGSADFLEHEAHGLPELGGCSCTRLVIRTHLMHLSCLAIPVPMLQHSGCAVAVVLVAGGLGERLGFSGIKVALPWQTSSGETYLELYIRNILAMQQAASLSSGKPVMLPLAIMVSDDTAARTAALLQENANYGMVEGQVRRGPPHVHVGVILARRVAGSALLCCGPPVHITKVALSCLQITLLKQEKVPCLSDNEARLALDPKDPFQLMTKPHGHGDVHYLLHSSGTVEKWAKVRPTGLCTVAC